MTVQHLHFPAGHPTAAGHFPGNPIIPGALLLDDIIRAVHTQTGRATTAIRAAKFLAPVRPGDTLVLTWHATANATATFECRRAATMVASGTLTFADAAA